MEVSGGNTGEITFDCFSFLSEAGIQITVERDAGDGIVGGLRVGRVNRLVKRD